MNEDLQANTPAFFTLDGFDGALAKRMLPVIQDALQDNIEGWTTLVANEPNLRERLESQGLETPDQFDSIPWDQATLLFTSGMAVTNEHLPLQIGERLTRERFGRFPHQDGSALGYFLEHIRPNRSITDNDGEDMYDNIVSLITQLAEGLTEAHQGHPHYESGFGGLQLLGYLTPDEVSRLRKLLAGRSWTVSFDEPLDGGIADVAKHFTTLLKAAERRCVGLVHRRHR